MSSYALPQICADGDVLNAHQQHLLQHASATTLPTGSGILWRSWGKGTVLVLLHDWNSNWEEWLHNIAPLTRKFQVWVAQLPHAQSQPTPQWKDTQAWAKAIQNDLRTLCPSETLSLVGHGWGSILAGYLAPDMVQLSSLVLLGVGGRGYTPHLPVPQPDLLAAMVQRHWQEFHKPTLLIWGEVQGVPSPSQVAIALATGHEEREWMALPNASCPLPQTRATEVNMVLMPWLLSHT